MAAARAVRFLRLLNKQTPLKPSASPLEQPAALTSREHGALELFVVAAKEREVGRGPGELEHPRPLGVVAALVAEAPEIRRTRCAVEGGGA